jgi:hypothetical protein
MRGGTISKVAIETATVKFSEEISFTDITYPLNTDGTINADRIASGNIQIPMNISVNEPSVE